MNITSSKYIRLFILIYLIIVTFPKLSAQHAKEKISFTIKNASLEEFIKKIEELSSFSFIYSEDIRINKKISLNIQQQTVEEVLAGVFLHQPVSYTLSGKHILLKKKEPKPSHRKFTISGYIIDDVSKETLIGANVIEKLQNRGTVTNPYGFYTITLPEGETRLNFSYLGYSTQQHTFKLQRDTILNIYLSTDNMLEEVVIVSDRTETGITSTHTGALDIPITQIKNTPVILGESDAMKTIQLMPGVQAGVEGSAGLYVRGGSPDQNLILLDGVPIYNVDHVLGFFSVFTPEAIKKVTLFKGSFPARFGGRLSSVIDVRTNDGDMNAYHGSVTLGLLATKLNVEGPICKDRTSFNISLRRSYLDLVTRPFMSDDTKVAYYFYDINAKINHKFSDKNRLFLSIYHGKDHLDTKIKDEWSDTFTKDNTDINWGNTIFALRWNNILNNKLFSNTTIAYNQYRMKVDSESFMEYKHTQEFYGSNYNSGIQDVSAQIDFDYTPTPRHHIKFGGNFIHHKFRPEVMTSRISSINGEIKEDSTYRSISNSRIHANEFSVYAEDNFDLSSALRTNIGVHVSAFNVQGKTYFSLQPRFSARWQLNKDVVLKGAYSQMSQYINLLTSAPISMPTDLWVPVTKSIKPMQAYQYSLGAYYTGLKGWEFSVEGYYKNMKNILEYKDATRYIGSSSSWESKVEMGKGRSYGVEFMAQRTVGKTTGWISYALAKSDRIFTKGGINDGKRFPYKYDRRHQVDLIVNHKFNNRIDIGASWQFASGGTTTIAQEKTNIIRPYEDGQAIEEKDYVDSRNNYRLPASHRLNLGINFHKKTKRGMSTWNFSIYNVYNAMNPTFIHKTYKTVVDPSNNNSYYNYKIQPVLKKLTILPCIPSISYTYKF